MFFILVEEFPVLDFEHEKVLYVDWLYVGEVDVPPHLVELYGHYKVDENDQLYKDLIYGHGDEVPSAIGNAIYKQYRREAKQYNLDYEYGDSREPIP